MKKAIYGFAVAAALVTGLACSGGGPAATSEPGTGTASAVATASPSPAHLNKVGQTVTVKEEFLGELEGKYTLRIASAKTAQKEDATFAPSKPKKGTFLVLKVELICLEGVCDAYGFNFKFVGSDGTVYEADCCVSFGETLSADSLRKSQKTAGSVVFDVPLAEVKKGQLQYAANGYDDTATVLWTLA